MNAAPQPECPLLPRQPRFHPIEALARRMPYRSSLAIDCSSLLLPSRGTVRAFDGSPPTMPFADFFLAVRGNRFPLSQFLPHAESHGTRKISRGKTQNVPRVDAEFIKHTPTGRWRTSRSRARPSRVYHTSDPVRVPRPRAFGLGFLQTPSHDEALALLLAFGSSYTWLGDFHPDSSVPCPAHTSCSAARFSASGAAKVRPRALYRGYAVFSGAVVRARDHGSGGAGPKCEFRSQFPDR
jgi:hypothetical protein